MKNLVLLVVIFSLAGCSNLSIENPFEKPRVYLTNVEILDTSGFTVRLGVGLNIQNPNPLPIPIQGLSYELHLNGNEVASGVTSSIEEIGAYSDSDVYLEVGTNLFDVMGLFRDLLSADTTEISYQLNWIAPSMFVVFKDLLRLQKKVLCLSLANLLKKIFYSS